MKKKIIALLLVLSMTIAMGGMAASAELAKHERVYIVADSNGSVLSLTDSIRLENRDGTDEITDSTMLNDVQNIGGDQSFTQEGNSIVWQAMGENISYQGTSDKTPDVLPIVRFTLDGKEVTASELSEEKGDATVTVEYRSARDVPTLTVTALVLPESGVSDLKTENAAVLEEAGYRALVGWSVTGADESLKLPVSFHASFRADHPDFSWMMTFVSTDPIDRACREADSRIDLDVHAELDDAKALLTAMSDGVTLPETTGKTSEIGPKVNELNDALTKLNDGAGDLADGAKSLSEGMGQLKDGTNDLNNGAQQLLTGTGTLRDGANDLNSGALELLDGTAALKGGAFDLNNGTKALAEGAAALAAGAKEAEAGAQQLYAALEQIADGSSQVNDGASRLADGSGTLLQGLSDADAGAGQLQSGLGTLTAENDALNQGAQKIFAVILENTNSRIAASGLESAGIVIPELTEDNYAVVLSQVLEQLNPDALEAASVAAAEGIVRPQVEAKTADIRAAVEAEVKNSVLTAVLKSAQVDLSAEEYNQAVQWGQIPAEQNAAIQATVTEQMESEAVKEKIEQAVQAQIDQLVSENVQKALASDQTASAKLAAAQDAFDSLSSLKEQLDQINAFVTGLQEYTAGVSRVEAGASGLRAGIGQLKEGADALAGGAQALSEGTASLNNGILQVTAGSAALQEGTESLSDGAEKLSGGATTLDDGAARLATGAQSLHDGMGRLSDGTAQLSGGAQDLYDGVKELANGTSRLYDGAQELCDGSETLRNGAEELQEEGTQKLLDEIYSAEKEASEQLMKYLEDDLENALDIFEDMRDKSALGGFDLRNDGIEMDTVYIIRTDLEA